MSRPLVIVVVALVLVGVLLVAGGGGLLKSVGDVFRPFSLAPFAMEAGGMTILSADCKVPVISNLPTLQEAKCLVLVSVSGASESVTAGVGDLRQKGSKYETGSINIRVTSFKEEARYRVVNEGIPLTLYSVASVIGKGDSYAESVVCPGDDWKILMDKDSVGWPFPTIYWEWVCVSKVDSGVLGVVSLASLSSQSEITVTGPGGTQTATVNTREGTGANLGSAGSVSWVGSLMTGNEPPAAVGNAGGYVRSLGKWNLITSGQRQAYISARDKFESFLDIMKTDCNNRGFGFGSTSCDDLGKTKATFDQEFSPVASAYNSIRDQPSRTLLSQATGEYLQVTGDITGGIDAGSLTLQLTQRITNPELRFLLNADWVGLVIPVGEPEIVGATCTPVPAGQQGTAIIQVRNKGAAPGAFDVALTQCGVGLYNAGRVTVQPGQTIGVPVPIQFTASGIQNCVAKVTDTASFQSVTQGVACQITEKTATCVEGQTQVAGNTYAKCENGRMKTILSCTGGQTVIVEGSTPKCVTSGGEFGTAQEVSFEQATGETIQPETRRVYTCDLWCKLGRVNKVIWLVVGLLVFGLVFIGVRMRRGY